MKAAGQPATGRKGSAQKTATRPAGENGTVTEPADAGGGQPDAAGQDTAGPGEFTGAAGTGDVDELGAELDVDADLADGDLDEDFSEVAVVDLELDLEESEEDAADGVGEDTLA
ncbi:MAG: hypothetical protein J2P34_02605, partial [Actinobacteria bacterium]|nr:hypothetical protein [Actinomycetota bacterium]